MNVLIQFKKQHGKPQKPSYEVMPHSGRVFKAALVAKIEQAYEEQAYADRRSGTMASHVIYSH